MHQKYRQADNLVSNILFSNKNIKKYSKYIKQKITIYRNRQKISVHE